MSETYLSTSSVDNVNNQLNFAINNIRHQQSRSLLEFIYCNMFTSANTFLVFSFNSRFTLQYNQANSRTNVIVVAPIHANLSDGYIQCGLRSVHTRRQVAATNRFVCTGEFL